MSEGIHQTYPPPQDLLIPGSQLVLRLQCPQLTTLRAMYVGTPSYQMQLYRFACVAVVHITLAAAKTQMLAGGVYAASRMRAALPPYLLKKEVQPRG